MANSIFEEFLDARTAVRSNFLEPKLAQFEAEYSEIFENFEKYGKALIRAKKTGNFKSIKSNDFRKLRGSFKENSCPNSASEIVPLSTTNDLNTLRVKTEKLSILSDASNITEKENVKEMPAPTIIPPKKKRVKKEKDSSITQVKQESLGFMPETKRTTRSKATAAERNSDVILQNPPVPIVELSDSEEEKVEVKATVRSTRTRTKKAAVAKDDPPSSNRSTQTNKVSESEDESGASAAPVRMTRTKTKAKPKRERSPTENKTYKNKRSKSDSATENDPAINTSGRTEYEDAVSELDAKVGNATFICPTKATETQETKPRSSPRHQNLNTTVIVEKSTVKSFAEVSNADDLLTDDESINEKNSGIPKKINKPIQKQVFSPYDRSPVKKKVEAFEKFQNNEVQANSKANTSKILKEIGENKGNVKDKAKGFTPLSSKIHYKGTPLSETRVGKYNYYKSAVNDSMSLRCKTPLNSSKIMKTGLTDFREKELRRQEREKEQKKKEMMKRAMSEDRKKKYEEKLLKVQQQKEVLEKEREKALEAQRLKEERYKLLLQQKEEKQRQLKEENEKKRLLAKQRAEEKKKEEARFQAQENIMNEQIKKKQGAETLHRQVLQKTAGENVPVYMVRPAPRLPCADCYDSDEEDGNSKRFIPDWATNTMINRAEYIQYALGHRIKNTLFCCQSQSVDLKEIFERIDPRKLKRTSSANWTRAPRFTLLPHLEED